MLAKRRTRRAKHSTYTKPEQLFASSISKGPRCEGREMKEVKEKKNFPSYPQHDRLLLPLWQCERMWKKGRSDERTSEACFIITIFLRHWNYVKPQKPSAYSENFQYSAKKPRLAFACRLREAKQKKEKQCERRWESALDTEACRGDSSDMKSSDSCLARATSADSALQQHFARSSCGKIYLFSFSVRSFHSDLDDVEGERTEEGKKNRETHDEKFQRGMSRSSA